MFNFEKKLFIGIDPGMNGGISFIKPEMDSDYVKAVRCPKTAHEMARLLEVGMASNGTNAKDTILFIEHVWSFPGDGRVSAFRFGYNYGLWKGLCASQEIDIYNVAPRKWQGSFDIPDKTSGRERKRWLKEHAESLYPNIKITFNTADAILIASYAKDLYYDSIKNGEEMPEAETGLDVIQ